MTASSSDLRVAILASPTAGRGRAAGQLANVLVALREAGARPEPVDARTAADAVAACRRAVQDAVTAVVAVGGDGTVHLAVQAVAETSVRLGVVPLGTGNDFATAVGVPLDVPAAVAALADDLRQGASTPVDAVRSTAANGDPLRWWVSVLASGFDSAVNERANRMRWPRGPRRYDVAILRELMRLKPREFALELDGQRWSGPAISVAVGNTATYGGGMRVCPTADPTDGLLDVTVVGPVGRAELVRVKPQLYAGTHVDHPGVSTYRAASVTLQAAGVAAYADGEPLGALPLTVTCVPGALQVAGIRRAS